MAEIRNAAAALAVVVFVMIGRFVGMIHGDGE